MATLAVRDEQPTFTPTHVRQSQPEDFATAQTSEQHRVDHRPIPIRSQRRAQFDDVVVIEDPRQMPNRSNQRDHPPITRHRRTHRHAALHRIVVEFPDRDEVRIEPRHRRQTTTNGRQRQPVGLIDRDHRRIGRTGPLDADELEHMTSPDLQRVDVDDGEEHLQVVNDRQRRVRSKARHEPTPNSRRRVDGRASERRANPSQEASASGTKWASCDPPIKPPAPSSPTVRTGGWITDISTQAEHPIILSASRNPGRRWWPGYGRADTGAGSQNAPGHRADGYGSSTYSRSSSAIAASRSAVSKHTCRFALRSDVSRRQQAMCLTIMPFP